jgi:hypothetical protein
VTNGIPPIFEVVLTVTDNSTNSQLLRFGYHPDATNDFDVGLDELAPSVPPAGTFDARLLEGCINCVGLVTDFRPETDSSTVFEVQYAAEMNQEPIRISWDPSLLPADYDFTIVDRSTGTQFGPLDMRTTNHLVADQAVIADGLQIIVERSQNVSAGFLGPDFPLVALTPQCTFKCTVQIDMSNSPAPNDFLGSFTGSITFNPELSFLAHSPILSGYMGNVVVDQANRIVRFNGINSDGQSGLVDLIAFEFAIIANTGDTIGINLDFSAMAAANSFTNLLPVLNVEDFIFIVQQSNKLGDVNGDDVVNSTDALIILSYDVNKPIPQEILNRIMVGIGDVNNDRVTNSTDVLYILSADVGIPVPVPIGQVFCFE